MAMMTEITSESLSGARMSGCYETHQNNAITVAKGPTLKHFRGHGFSELGLSILGVLIRRGYPHSDTYEQRTRR